VLIALIVLCALSLTLENVNFLHGLGWLADDAFKAQVQFLTNFIQAANANNPSGLVSGSKRPQSGREPKSPHERLVRI